MSSLGQGRGSAAIVRGADDPENGRRLGPSRADENGRGERPLKGTPCGTLKRELSTRSPTMSACRSENARARSGSSARILGISALMNAETRAFSRRRRAGRTA